jgi:hypothetical protein
MRKKIKILFKVIAAVVAVGVGLTQCTDSALNIFDKRSQHEKSTEICAKGEVVVVKAASHLGQESGNKLAKWLGSRCRVHGPTAPADRKVNISVNEIKYFHYEDEPKAQSLSQKALECCKIKASLKYLPEFAKKDEKRYHVGYFEVWLQ